LKVKLDEELNNDKEFANFMNAEKAIEKEVQKVQTIERSGTIFSRINSDNGVLDIREIDEHMKDIKRALFMPKSTYGWKGDSPALAWLKHAEQQAGMAQASFQKDYDKLQQDLWYFHTDSGGLNGAHYNRNKSMAEQNNQLIADMNKLKNLAILDLNLVGEKTKAHKNACQRLENIWFTWYTVVNNVAAQELVCDTISSHLTTGEVEEDLVWYCGYIDGAGKQQGESELNRKRKKLVNKSGLNAITIDDKFKQLQCKQFVGDESKP
jgi:hypothetical protein